MSTPRRAGRPRRFVTRTRGLGSTTLGAKFSTFKAPYLSSLSCPTQVSQAGTVGTEVIISLQGLSKGGCVFLDTFAIAQTLELKYN